MQREYERVRQFHETYEVPIRSRGHNAMEDTEEQLRKNLIAEELKELSDALIKLCAAQPGEQEELIALVDTADALGDTLYVVAGTMVQGGYSFTFDHTCAALKSILADGFNEVMSGLSQSNHGRVCKGMAMMELGIKGFCHITGIDFDAVFEEIHSSNMSKLGEDGKPIFRRSDGKVLKGPNFRPPDLMSIISGDYEEHKALRSAIHEERVLLNASD